MNCIRFNQETGVFSIETKNSSYQMQVGEYQVLLHLYYGANVGNSEITYRMVDSDRGFSGNPPEANGATERAFSLDVRPQEYSGWGNGDYRISGLELRHADGSDIADLRYESYEIRPGKYSLPGMPAMFGTEKEAQTLEIVLCDAASGVKAHLLYGVFPEKDIITRSVYLENTSSAPVAMERAASMQLDYPERDLDLMHFYGKHACERMAERVKVHHGIQSVESKRGSSSHHHNPFVILCDGDTTEDAGECYGFALVYSGNFSCEIEKDSYEQTRLVMGINPYHFTVALQPGERFDAPEVIMAYSENGLARLSHLFHDAYRDNLIRSRYVDQPRPILINNWEATYFGFDENKLFDIAKAGKEMGLDLFVMDDGWFGKREDDNSGLGDWVVNEKKLKGGLPALVDRVNGIGMKFGLWIEPEMVSEDSDLYRAHPDWCLNIPGRGLIRSRNQLNLDVSRKEVRDHVMDQIFSVLDITNVEYIKWDMNRSLANVYSHALTADRQGELYHRYVLGVYDMMERLVSRYPDLLFENCSGGGGRFDAGMLYYSPQIWCSDNTDAIDRLKIQYGTSFGYPLSSMGAHVSVCPNHQTGRITPLETRGLVASAGTFGFELNLVNMTAEEKAISKEMIRHYKEQEHLVQKGDYYRLTDPFKNTDYVAWEFAAKDQSEAAVKTVLLRGECNQTIHLLRVKGLDKKARYQETYSGKIYGGAALMKAGIPLPLSSGDYQGAEFHFVRV